MSSIIEQIRSRGHWQVRIRPEVFRQDRVANILQLQPILFNIEVRLRGWYFPQLRLDAPYERHEDWVGQASQWSHYLEAWRFYQSGQFFDLSGMWEDWIDQSEHRRAPDGWKPGNQLWVNNTVHRLSEILEFAARLAMTDAGDETMNIAIDIIGLANRELVVDDPNHAPMWPGMVTALDRFQFKRVLQREQLVAESRELALEPAIELFRRFGWDAPIANLRGVQDALRWQLSDSENRFLRKIQRSVYLALIRIDTGRTWLSRSTDFIANIKSVPVASQDARMLPMMSPR